MYKKKSLGQHFLNSPHYLAMIADAAQIVPGERVLEVGPGEGALTQGLLARGAQVLAIEKDRRLIPLLQEKFAQEIADKKLNLIEDDILKYDISYFFNQDAGYRGQYKLVANIPYYITGAILEKFLSSPRQPAHAVLLVQKEVAQRVSRDPKESILSLSVKAYGTPAYVKTVPAGAFSPPPEVDSAILAIHDISRGNFADARHEERFFALVHAGFAHKRKLLASNLAPLLGGQCADMLEGAGIAQNARAENVPLAAWLALSRASLAI